MRTLALLTVICLLMIGVANAQSIEKIEWCQGDKKVDFVTPNVEYKAIIYVYSDKDIDTTIEVWADIVLSPDYVVAIKPVHLHAGENVVEVPFVFYHTCISENGENPYAGIRGVYIRIPGVYDVSDVSSRFRIQAEIPISSYYWVGLRMKVNGVEYKPDDYAPIYGGDTVEMYGYLYKDGKPVPNFKIRWIFIIGGETSYTTTDENGYFYKVTVAPDWSKYGLCGEKGRYYAIQAIDSSGAIVTFWEYNCRYMCKSTVPTPTPTPTTTPTKTIPTQPTTTPPTPGFEALFALAVILSLAYILKRGGKV